MPKPAKHIPHDGLEGLARILAVIAFSLGTVLTILDGTILNVALPALVHEFHISDASSVLIVNAYQVSMLMAVLPLSALGERYGYRRIFLGSLTVFMTASLACATSRTLDEIVVARALQGIGGAGIVGLLPALIRTVYPARLLGRGLGINSMLVATSSTIGPSVAAAILAVAPWPYLFVINLPLCLLALVLGVWVLPWNEPPHKRFDAAAAAMTAVSLGLFILAVDTISQGGNWLISVVLLTGAGMISPLLLRHQAQHPAPFLPMDVLKNPVIKLSFVAGQCGFVAQLLAFISLPFYFHGLGMSQVQIGLLMTPWPLAIALTAPLAGILCDRFAPAIIGALGLLICTVALLLLAFLPPGTAESTIAVLMAVAGVGFGLFSPPNLRQIMSAAPKHRSGVVSGLIATNRLIGQSIGAALAALTLNLAATHANQAALSIAATMTLVGAGLSMARSPTIREAVKR